MPDMKTALTFSTYGLLAAETDQDIGVGSDPLELSVPLLGMAGEVGSLFLEQKKRYRGDSELSDWSAFISEELGDLLWYASAVCRHLGSDLDTVMKTDADQLQGMESTGAGERFPAFDLNAPLDERFPRQLQLRFVETQKGGEPVVTMMLRGTVPNAFPDGAVPLPNDKWKGYTIGTRLGDPVNDNSHSADAYRYHDAVHLGFLAVLQWSPNLRSLLRLKRKFDPRIDDAEDGARAIFAEEGLAAILAKQAFVNDSYLDVRKVPEELLELIASVTEDLEVSVLPLWLWAEAICQGFAVLGALARNRGGFVLADLDAGSLTYSKTPFTMRDDDDE
jgi:NTP pyrophosphatase (non-canonical NTP hydrolase)